MNAMQTKTPEERKAIAMKGHETKRRKKEQREKDRREALAYADGLRETVEWLEARRDLLQKTEVINCVAAELTSKALLTEKEIAAAALPWRIATGVYFLLKEGNVVYVGQSINVYARIMQHKDKCFDTFAYIPCENGQLDILESLYIHLLRPSLNGTHFHGGKMAQISLESIIGVTKRAKQ